uniref:Uncharacterized protein n=1 Tax=Moniliophthora roreri TaxID=221103 RepID=A0A0W0FZ63_MONRR
MGTLVQMSVTPEVLSSGSPLSHKLLKTDSPPLPVRPPNPQPMTPSFILSPLPLPTSSQKSNQVSTNPFLQPPSTPKVFRRLKPQFHHAIETIPAVSRKDQYEEDMDEDGDIENQTLSNDDNPPTMSLRSLTPLPTPMMQLVDCVSALCVDWNAISPEIAHSTCVADASRLSLRIHLGTALTNEGLATLHIDGLVQVQTLCQMIAVMMMNLTATSGESVEEIGGNNDRDVKLMFVRVDLQKVGRFSGLLSIDERVASGWQPTLDVPATPMLRSVDEMPNTLEDYDTELYGDGES